MTPRKEMLNQNQRVVVSIGGGHGTGIQNAAQNLTEALEKSISSLHVNVINIDELGKTGEKKTYTAKDYNFNDIRESILQIENNTNANSDEVNLILLVGHYALYDKQINKLVDLKVYYDSDDDDRLIKLIRERKTESSEQLDVLLTEYMNSLRVEMHKYITPTRAFADLIIPSMKGGLGCAILVDGIKKLIEPSKSHTSSKKKVPELLKFDTVQIDLQKARYGDLS